MNDLISYVYHDVERQSVKLLEIHQRLQRHFVELLVCEFPY